MQPRGIEAQHCRPLCWQSLTTASIQAKRVGQGHQVAGGWHKIIRYLPFGVVCTGAAGELWFARTWQRNDSERNSDSLPCVN